MNLCPSVGLGPPRQKPERYEKWDVDDVSVYVPRGFEPLNLLTIELKRPLGFKTLEIEGWKLI